MCRPAPYDAVDSWPHAEDMVNMTYFKMYSFKAACEYHVTT